MVGSAPSRYDRERAEGAAFEEVHDNRVAERLGEVAQKAVGAEIAADLLIVEDDPAQGFQPIVLAARQEFSRASSEIFQDNARLGELLLALRPFR